MPTATCCCKREAATGRRRWGYGSFGGAHNASLPPLAVRDPHSSAGLHLRAGPPASQPDKVARRPHGRVARSFAGPLVGDVGLARDDVHPPSRWPVSTAALAIAIVTAGPAPRADPGKETACGIWKYRRGTASGQRTLDESRAIYGFYFGCLFLLCSPGGGPDECQGRPQTGARAQRRIRRDAEPDGSDHAGAHLTANATQAVRILIIIAPLNVAISPSRLMRLTSSPHRRRAAADHPPRANHHL